MAEGNNVEPFGAKRAVSTYAPVPMFDPLLQSARDIVGALDWFKREIAKADMLCTNMESICVEMEQAKIAEFASKHVTQAVQRLRTQITRVSEFCQRMEALTADLQDSGMLEEGTTTFKMPRAFTPVEEKR